MADNLLKGFGNPEQSVNYNHFDRSYHNPYTCKAGQEIPVCCVETDPGDKVQVSIAAMVRSMPLATAAMLRAKINFEWYFVPFSQLNHNWNSIFGTVNEFGSSTDQNVFTEPDIDLPYLDMVSLLTTANTNGSSVKDIFGRDMRGDAAKLLDMLDYGSFPLIDQSGTKSLKLPVFMSNNVPYDVNPFRLQAYQKIWNCYHRDKYYDPIDQVAAQGYNTDDIQMGSGTTPSILSQRSYQGSTSQVQTLMNMCALRYHRWKTDQFMGALPSRQDGVVSSVSLNNVRLNNVLPSGSLPSGTTVQQVNIGVSSSPSQGYFQVMKDVNNGTITGSSYWNIPNAFDVLALRQAEALQAWKESTLRAGKNMNKQFKAHTGFTPKFAIDNYPEFVGSFDANVSVDEVISTSDSLTTNQGTIEGAQLGQIAGKGISVTGRNQIKYFARDHGILMCIAYILPEVSYNSTGVNPFNTKLRRSSYYMKEFENTGLVPIMRRDLDISLVSTSQQMNSVLGYLPYGYESKTNYDRVHGELQYNRSLQTWTPSRSDLIQAANAIPATGGMNKGVRYVNPSILNKVFAFDVDETEATDQFIVNLYNDVKVLSNKSVLGLPKY